MAGAMLFGALLGSAEYQRDFAAAKDELAALRKAGRKPAGPRCEAEKALSLRNPY